MSFTSADTRVCAFCGVPLHFDCSGVIWMHGLEYHTICVERLKAYGTRPLAEADVRRIVREELAKEQK